MSVRESFRRFTERVARSVDKVARTYGLSDVGYDAVALDENLPGTGVGGYYAVDENGRSILGVSPEVVCQSDICQEVADHEGTHSLLPPNKVGGIYSRLGRYLANISAVLAEGDVMRNMVELHGYNPSQIRGYEPIKDGLLRIGKALSSAAGGASRLYQLVRERGQRGLIELITSRADLTQALDDFYTRYSPEILERYGMLVSEPCYSPTIRITRYG